MVTAGDSRETYRCKNKKWKIYKRKVTTDLNKFNNCDEKKEDDLMAKVENKPKMVSLFSGCGGLDLGFETAGFNIIWANDFDSDAQAVYKLNFGKIDGRDILDVSEDEIPDCDILTAGFPCQPFSSAGHHEVISIHPERKTVSVKNLENGEIFEENYDKLILSPGAKPTQPRLPGVGMDKLFTLRTVEDTFRIKEYINKNHPKSAVLAGGGFIGLELAENLRELGMDVTIVQRPKQLMNPFDPDMASMIHNEMRKHGIKLVLGYTVEGFKEKDNGVEVLLKDNPSLQADMVVLAIGVTPDTVLAKEAGLELGIKESIVVNDRMETSVPDIYAAGDAVQVKHYVTGNDALISLAGPANKQGRIIADNICGGDSRYLGSQGSSVIKVFDMTAATTGINETNAKKSGLEVDTVILSPMSHAG